METTDTITPEEKLHICIAAANRIDIGVAVLNNKGEIWFWNRWLAEKSGLSADTVTCKTLLGLFPELSNSRLESATTAALKYGLTSLLSQSLNKSPLPLFENPSSPVERLRQAIQATPIESSNGERFCLIQVNDISLAVRKERLLREQAEKLRGLAYIDSLTGIPNRRRMDEYLADEYRRAARSNESISVIMADIDYFKQYNDKYGHQAGDFCLQRVANAIKANLRRPADLVARYGGEEFVIVLPDTHMDGAVALADDIRKNVESLSIPHETSDVTGCVTLSLGVSSILPNLQHPENTLLSQADGALYQAKQKGRNRVTVYRERLQG